MSKTPSEVTHLLREWSDGDPEALGQLMPLVLDEVRDLASRALAGESPGHTLQPTALVNEVYLRLVDRRTYWWQDRSQFFSCLAELMRRILVDHARRRRAAKRGGDDVKLPLDEGILPAVKRDLDLVALDDALNDLKEIDPRRYRIVMLWYFVGLTQREIASELDISVNTVGRQLKSARLWLQRQVRNSDPED